MVGYLPQEAEAHGDETVLDVATGRVDELPRLEKRLQNWKKPATCPARNIWKRTRNTTR